MKTIYAILPCYNEEENIGKLIEEWNKQVEELKSKQFDLKIVAIDDCSTDKTKSVILEKKDKFNNVDIIIHKENLGLCGGLNSAIEYFNKNGKNGDLLILMDGDNTHDPKYVHNMLGALKEDVNCVIASRYREGANVIGLAKNRELMSDFAKIYYKVTLNIPNVRDYTCGYRMYTYEIIDKLLKKFGNEPIKEKSFACMMELLYKIYLVGGKFEEIGFELRYDNKCGQSKMRVIKTAQRSIIAAIKLKVRYNIFSFINIILLILFSIFLSLGTNYSPINASGLNHDCGIFSYVGFAMQNGRILYSEVWENKGPLLYFIYYIGLCINRNYGIYILELISIFISLIFSYKTLKVITNRRAYSILGVFYAFSIWSVTFEKGTFSESFALPLICIGVYMFSKYMLQTKKTTNIQMIFWGILTGLIAQLRLNLLSIFLSVFLTIGILLIKDKQFKQILNWIIYGVIGVVISVIPSIIYLTLNGALIECINIAYIDILGGYETGTTSDKLRALIAMVTVGNISGTMTLLLFFIILSVVLINIKKFLSTEEKSYILATILCIAINLYANSLSGAAQMHYFISFIPIILMATGFMLKLFDKIKIKYIHSIFMISVLIVIFSFKSYLLYYISYIEENKIPLSANSINIKINEYILNNSNKTDTVQLIGGRMESVCANFNTERLSASKYSYLPLWPSFTKERKTDMTNELVTDLMKNNPKLIMICQYNNNANEFYDLINDKESWDNFLRENYIKDEKSIEYYVVYARK